MGAVWEVTGHEGAARRFREGLDALVGQAPARAVSDLEVVIRHASERRQARTADAAASVLGSRFPNDPDAAEIAAAWARARPFQLALAEADPEARVTALLALLEAADDSTVAETHTGHQLVDALLDLLLERGDDRAVGVAQRLYHAKVALHGADVPAAWPELQNVGTALARLGRTEEARDCLVRAIDGLERHVGPDQPHVQMARRNLDRLG